MVVSKKCKICTALDADNILISGEYFGKALPDLIQKISGLELDPRKANGVLICKHCAIQVVYTDVIIDKLRSTLHRLTKSLKVAKLKTPLKSLTSQAEGNLDVKYTDGVDNTITEKGEVHSFTNADEPKSKSTKKVVGRRKSVLQESGVAKSEKVKVSRRTSLFPTDKVVEEGENPKYSETSTSGKNVEFQKTSDTKLTPHDVSLNSAVEHKNQVEPKQKTPKKVFSVKSALSNDIQHTNKNEIQQNGKGLDNLPPTKFEKIVDSDASPVKATKNTKRKRISNGNSVDNSDTNLKFNIFDTTPVKRNKAAAISAFDESPMDLTIDEQDSTGIIESSFIKDKAKILNCVICGKGFSQKCSLREHIESSHMGEKLKQCSHCSVEFRSQQKYETHVFSEKCKNSKHVCPYPNCNKRFKTVHKMELHMQEKHPSQQESEDK